MKLALKVVLAVCAVFILPVVVGGVWGWNTPLREINFGLPVIALTLIETIGSFLIGTKLMQATSNMEKQDEPVAQKNSEYRLAKNSHS